MYFTIHLAIENNKHLRFPAFNIWSSFTFTEILKRTKLKIKHDSKLKSYRNLLEHFPDIDQLKIEGNESQNIRLTFGETLNYDESDEKTPTPDLNQILIHLMMENSDRQWLSLNDKVSNHDHHDRCLFIIITNKPISLQMIHEQFIQQCPQKMALQIRKKIFPLIPDSCFDQTGDRCYCIKCHKQRKDKLIYQRGEPSQKYALPIGWVRFGLKINITKCRMNDIWRKWHVAYHGTAKANVTKIFESGLSLLKPGDRAIDGDTVSIKNFHIKKPCKRLNKYTKKEEVFDPNQIYLSPSVKYCSNSSYSEWYECQHPFNDKRKIKVQFAFQLRVKPGSYNIGQETVGATTKNEKIDDHFSNDEIEWYTKHHVNMMIHGLLFNIKDLK